MGALCVQVNYENNKKAEKQRKATDASNTYMAQIIRTYISFYGKPVTKQTEDFIQKNYDSTYYSTTKYDGVNQTGTITYRSDLTTRLSDAYKNNCNSVTYCMEEAQQNNGRLWYNWSVRTSNGLVRYRCFAEFNSQQKLFRQTFTKLIDTDYSKYMFQQPKKQIYPQTQNNLSYQRPPERFDGDAYVRQSNAEFRDRMNKQAQEWNNYAIQKNNRGY